MFTAESDSCLAIQVFEKVLSFMKVTNQLDESLDEDDYPTLCELFQSNAYYGCQLASSLDYLRREAGACLSQASRAANIEGLFHASDNKITSLHRQYESFLIDYQDFLQELADVVKFLGQEYGQVLPNRDLGALEKLEKALQIPLLKSKLTALAQQQQQIRADGSVTPDPVQ